MGKTTEHKAYLTIKRRVSSATYTITFATSESPRIPSNHRLCSLPYCLAPVSAAPGRPGCLLGCHSPRACHRASQEGSRAKVGTQDSTLHTPNPRRPSHCNRVQTAPPFCTARRRVLAFQEHGPSPPPFLTGGCGGLATEPRLHATTAQQPPIFTKLWARPHFRDEMRRDGETRSSPRPHPRVPKERFPRFILRPQTALPPP